MSNSGFMNDVQEVGMILEHAKTMNQLFKESSDIEREYSKKIDLCKAINYKVKEFKDSIKTNEITAACVIFDMAVSSYQDKLEKEYEPYLDKFRKATTIQLDLWKRIDKLCETAEKYRNFHVKVDEELVKTYSCEIIGLLLICNLRKEINEDDFFEDKDEFFKILRKVDNEKIRTLVEQYLNDSYLTKNTDIKSYIDMF